ncbi:ATP-grasp domain-containing protein [Streptomyces sp. T-3]|nr:ATP-grasp domain-containing protein [Streptomyces sp. T-3]
MSAAAASRTVVIVDAYASARCLAPVFQAQGYHCVHVQSTPETPSNYAASFRPADFRANIVHSGDVSSTVEAIAGHAPTALIPGVERAVVLADRLSEKLGLPTNGTLLSRARRDKHLMLDTVRAAGVPSADQFLAGDLGSLLRWYAGTEGRVVLKPVSSAGNDSIAHCRDATQVRAAFEGLIGTDNALGQRNDAVLAQEYLAGHEYIVNTVGRDGKHHVCDIWKVHHLSANGAQDVPAGSELLPRRGPEQDQLVAYTLQVLDALGIHNGPAHTELKLTPHGPRLIETGARICGADVHVPAGAATGESQLDWTVRACVDPERFHRRRDTDYQVLKHARIINMVSPVEGTLAGLPKMDRLRALESFHDVLHRVTPGAAIHPSVDDWTLPMRVYLLHEDPATVARDAMTTRYLDGDGFYAIHRAEEAERGAMTW